MENLLHIRDLSVQEGFTVCMCFFVDIWPLIRPKLPPPDPNPFKQTYETNDLFCRVICLESECWAEWNEAVFRAVNIPKQDQQEVTLSPNEVFSCIIEFCKYYNQKYDLRLSYIVQLLENMKHQKSDHNRAEWQILKQAFIDAATGRRRQGFNWDAPLEE